MTKIPTKQPDPKAARNQVELAGLLILISGGDDPTNGRRPAPVLAGYKRVIAATKAAPCDTASAVRLGAIMWLALEYLPEVDGGAEWGQPKTTDDREALAVLRHEVAEAHRLDMVH